MAQFDKYSCTRPVSALAHNSADATVGEIVDTKGAKAVTFYAQLAAAAAWTAISVALEHSDDGVTFTAVSDPNDVIFRNPAIADPTTTDTADAFHFGYVGKMRYARALAQSDVDFDALAGLPDAEVIKRLTAITGIGVWTAEIYAKFSLGRADAFAAGDLALQEGARMLYGLAERPTEKELRAIAEAWRPWRSVAARILWAYYAYMKSREGIR